MREIQFGDGPAKYVYASEAEAEVRKAFERGREAAAEKIADLESQIESLQVSLDLSQDRAKDLEKKIEKQDADYEVQYVALTDCLAKIEKLEAVRVAAEHFVSEDCTDHHTSDKKLTLFCVPCCKQLQQALREAK